MLLQVLELLFTDPSYEAEVARRCASLAIAAEAAAGDSESEGDAVSPAVHASGGRRDALMGNTSSSSSSSSRGAAECWPAGGAAALRAGALCDGYVCSSLRRQILQHQQQHQKPQQQQQQGDERSDRSLYLGKT